MLLVATACATLLLAPPTRYALRWTPRCGTAAAMNLRVPEDSRTIDALIQRTKDNLAEGLIVVLHFNDPTAAPNTWDYSYGASAASSTEQLYKLANEYASSENYGGRPLIVLQIDRNAPSMDTICAKRGIVTFPTIQIWSRGESSA
eukprot:2047170-Prymnesium_polylepis.1